MFNKYKIVLLIVLINTCLFGCLNENQTNSDDNKKMFVEVYEQASEDNYEFDTVDHVRYYDTVITINDLYESEKIWYNTPSNDHIYKVFKVTINNVNDTFDFSFSSSFYLQDKNNNIYYALDINGMKRINNVIPLGMKVQGEIVFEVPKDTGLSKLIYSRKLRYIPQTKEYDFQDYISFSLDGNYSFPNSIYKNPKSMVDYLDIGETLDSENRKFTVNSISYVDGWRTGYTNTYIYFTIENKRDESYYFNSFWAFSLIDKDGNSYNLNNYAKIDIEDFIYGDIAPKEIKKGIVAFLVQEDVKELYLIVNSFSEDEKCVIKIK